MNAAVAVTTAPREVDYLSGTLRSLRNSGFRDVLVFDDTRGAGCVENWKRALRSLRSDDSDASLIVQDDTVWCAGASDWLARLEWPSSRCGVLSLYCSNFWARAPEGLFRIDRQQIGGCCALVVRPDAADVLLDADWGIRYKLDHFIGSTMMESGREVWCVKPSLCDHVGEVSSDDMRRFGHGGLLYRRRADSWIGPDQFPEECGHGV